MPRRGVRLAGWQVRGSGSRVALQWPRGEDNEDRLLAVGDGGRLQSRAHRLSARAGPLRDEGREGRGGGGGWRRIRIEYPCREVQAVEDDLGPATAPAAIPPARSIVLHRREHKVVLGAAGIAGEVLRDAVVAVSEPVPGCREHVDVGADLGDGGTKRSSRRMVLELGVRRPVQEVRQETRRPAAGIPGLAEVRLTGRGIGRPGCRRRRGRDRRRAAGQGEGQEQHARQVPQHRPVRRPRPAIGCAADG